MAIETPETTQTTSTYSIPLERVGEFEERVKRLRRRAACLGLELPVATEVEREFVVRYNRDGSIMRDALGRPLRREHAVFAVQASIVKLPGWVFLGAVEHTEEGNILRLVPGVEELGLDLVRYRTDPDTCEHCGTTRRRNATYLVLHEETAAVQRVGSNCLDDYLGADALRSLQYALELDFDCWLDSESYGAEWVSAFDTWTVLATTCAAIRLYGWRGRGQAAEDPCGPAATADLVFEALATSANNPDKLDDADRSILRGVTEADRAMATEIIEWAGDIPVDTPSDYMNNLRVACALAATTQRRAGIVCSAVVAYDRARAREMERERTKDSQFVGRPGDKIGRKLTKKDREAGATALPPIKAMVARIVTVDGQYGTTWITVLHTDDGNVLVWNASSHPGEGIGVGTQVEIVATVKGHSTYAGVKQTKITRACLTRLGAEDAAA